MAKRPKVTSVQIHESHQRLDGATDYLLSALVEGERKWLAIRETAEQVLALPRDEIAVTKCENFATLRS